MVEKKSNELNRGKVIMKDCRENYLKG